MAIYDLEPNSPQLAVAIIAVAGEGTILKFIQGCSLEGHIADPMRCLRSIVPKALLEYNRVSYS